MIYRNIHDEHLNEKFQKIIDETMLHEFPPNFYSGFQPSENNDDFNAKIRISLQYLELHSIVQHQISSLSESFNIKRRRLYDAVHVFISVGRSKKSIA
jgi:LPS O-antigen subunit length determinant protein (WzzB/FepE family)